MEFTCTTIDNVETCVFENNPFEGFYLFFAFVLLLVVLNAFVTYWRHRI